jgi:hypothetical protein
MALGVLIAVLIGRGIHLADRKQAEALAAQTADPNFVVDPPATHPHLDQLIPQQRIKPAENMQVPGTSDRA